MFQPQPTPYSPSYASYGIHIANAEVPEYTFQPSPLGTFGTGQAGGAGAGTVAVAVAGGRPAAEFFPSPIFHNNQNHNPLISPPANNPNHLPYNNTNTNTANSALPHGHHQNHRNIKMESSHPTDLAQQEAAARDFKPQLEVSILSYPIPILFLFFSFLF